jgi:hypothetical protein
LVAGVTTITMLSNRFVVPGGRITSSRHIYKKDYRMRMGFKECHFDSSDVLCIMKLDLHNTEYIYDQKEAMLILSYRLAIFLPTK